MVVSRTATLLPFSMKATAASCPGSDGHSSPSAEDDLPGANRWAEISSLLTTLYQVADRLERLFPGRKFTPDGHLVGSIGEVVAAHMFGLKLLPGSVPNHDAISDDGRNVQIKFTQGTKSVALRAEPEHLLVLRLTPDRSIELVYNGKGHDPWLQAGKMQKNGQRPISLSHLRLLDASVSDHHRLLRRETIDLSNCSSLSG